MWRNRLAAIAVASTLLVPLSPAAHAQEVPFCHPGIRQLLRGDSAGAIRTLRPDAASASAATDDLSSLTARGVAALIEGNLEEASALLGRAVEIAPSADNARYNRGLARLASSDLAGAAEDFELVASLESSQLGARAAYHRALVSAHRSDWRSAEAWSQRALQLDSLLPDARLMLGYSLERQNKWAAAGQEYKTFVADYPSATWAMVRFAVTAMRAGFPETARAWLRRASQADPDSAEAVEARKYLVMLE